MKRASRAQCAAGIYTIEKVAYTVDEGAGEGSSPDETVTTKSTFILYRKKADHTHDLLPDVITPKLKHYVEQQIIQYNKDGRKAKYFIICWIMKTSQLLIDPHINKLQMLSKLLRIPILGKYQLQCVN